MTPRAWIQRALAIVGSSCALAMPAESVTLQPGDVVLAQHRYTTTALIAKLDPATLAPPPISQGHSSPCHSEWPWTAAAGSWSPTRTRASRRSMRRAARSRCWRTRAGSAARPRGSAWQTAAPFVGPDEVWTASHGYVAGRRGCFVRTRISDGASAFALEYSSCRSRGIAVAAEGMVYVSDCNTIGPDCYTLYTTRLPAGPTLTGYGGSLAVVPQGVVPARPSTWGVLKTVYR